MLVAVRLLLAAIPARVALLVALLPARLLAATQWAGLLWILALVALLVVILVRVVATRWVECLRCLSLLPSHPRSLPRTQSTSRKRLVGVSVLTTPWYPCHS
jgi:predicted anti-sigma-YlaC factor YlaD